MVETAQRIHHTDDSTRQLFFAFDQCHPIKNVRSQFLARDLGHTGEVRCVHLKGLYSLQSRSVVKPVRFLSRKHILPTNLEKMNVQRAVQVFLLPVTEVLQFMQQQAGHTCDVSYAGVGPTVESMSNVHKWFLLMNNSNYAQHIHRNLPESKPFEYADDARLTWLDSGFVNYLQDFKSQSREKEFIMNETFQGLLMTTASNVDCIRYLLTKQNFKFALTRKASSDPIEYFFE